MLPAIIISKHNDMPKNMARTKKSIDSSPWVKKQANSAKINAIARITLNIFIVRLLIYFSCFSLHFVSKSS